VAVFLEPVAFEDVVMCGSEFAEHGCGCLGGSGGRGVVVSLFYKLHFYWNIIHVPSQLPSLPALPTWLKADLSHLGVG